MPYTLPKEYKNLVLSACEEHEIPVWIFCRLIEQESGWDTNAVRKNRNGTIDRGLGQLNSRYLADFAWKYNKGKRFDPHDARHALRVSAAHLALLYRKTENWYLAVLAYNSGLSALEERNVQPASIRHARRIMWGEE